MIDLKGQVIDDLMERYQDHGVTREMLEELVNSGIKAGLSLPAIEMQARKSINKVCQLNETFSFDEILAVTGESPESLNARIKNLREKS